MIPTRTGVINSTGGAFIIDYSLTGDASTKYLTIDVNAVEVVNVSTSTSGIILVNPGDEVSIQAGGSNGTAITMVMTVTDNGSVVYTNTQTGDLSYTDFYSYFPTGNGSITVTIGTV